MPEIDMPLMGKVCMGTKKCSDEKNIDFNLPIFIGVLELLAEIGFWFVNGLIWGKLLFNSEYARSSALISL